MFAKYEYQAGSTLSNIMADIVALLTGETVVANLSADCVDANSYIFSTVAAGWTVYDASAGTNAQCLRALNLDGSTYKYLVVDLNTANKMYGKVYQSWDSGAHTGTNLSYNSDNTTQGCQKIDTTNGGVLYIGASARYAVFNSFAGGIWGVNTAGVYSPIGIFERTRAAAWDTVAAGYPPYVYLTGYFTEVGVVSTAQPPTISAPRIKGLSGDLTGINASLDASTEFGSGWAYDATYGINRPLKEMLPTVRGFDAALNLKHFMHEIAVVRKDQGWKAGKLYGIYLTTTSYGSAGDEITFNSAQYFVMTSGTSAGTGAGGRLAVPKF